MNILIVGNGFDLSHYLPTKYDHFMVAMGAIESWDELKGDMGFDDLFGSLYEKESYFFGYTKAMYKTDEIKISIDQIKGLKIQLKENVWYQYFSDHVREVKTWIDFETKIKEALEIVGLYFEQTTQFSLKNNYINREIVFEKSINRENIFLKREMCNVLRALEVVTSDYYEEEDDENNEIIYHKINNPEEMDENNLKFLINDKFLSFYSGFSKLKNNEIMDFLTKSLEKFINIFNLYFCLIINQLKLKQGLLMNNKKWIRPDKIFSFNYTKTYQKIYDSSIKIDYLHGYFGETQNIVLGISEFHNDILKNTKAYGFTKYHQKLLKNTDYIFLHDISERIMNLNELLDRMTKDYKNPNGNRTINQNNKLVEKINSTVEELKKIHGKIEIWGHSLDSSDDIYIKEIFELNKDKERFHVIVYYFNYQAKFELLANLLHILGKDKVEYWMKKGWLKFEKNPDIAEINDIKLIDLPQM